MKILCIDMNIIMAPCIRLYMDRVQTGDNPEIIWSKLERDMGIGAHLSYDAGILLSLAELIKKNKDADFVITESQKQNVAVIEKVFEKNTDGNPLQVTNIDFFCDIGTDAENSGFDFGIYDDDTWLGYLLGKKPEIRTRWVKAPESFVRDGVVRDIDISIMPVSEIRGLPQDHELIILSHSGRFVPYCYRHLGNLLGVISA